MFDDERSTKTFLTLENCKSSDNNVSHLQVEEDIIDETPPPTVRKLITATTEPGKILDEFQKKCQAIYSKQPTVNESEAKGPFKYYISRFSSILDPPPPMYQQNQYRSRPPTPPLNLLM